MTAVVVSALMWLLVASLLILRRGRAERNITYAAVVIAIAMTLNIDPVYLAFDELAGGTNLVTLVADLALMVGVFFLGRGVMKATSDPPMGVRVALGRAALAVALVSATFSFMFIDRGATTTNFMLDLGDQPAAASYSMIHFAYYGVVVAAMGALAASQLRRSSGVQLIPLGSLVLGSILGVILSFAVFTMDLAHVLGNLELMHAASIAYGTLYLLAFFFLCLGFAAQPAARTMQARSRARATRSLVAELGPLWQRAVSVRPGISQNEDAAFHADESETMLHRQIVEIRDAMIDTRVSFEVSKQERALVDRAERHLLGAVPADAPAEAAVSDGKLPR